EADGGASTGSFSAGADQFTNTAQHSDSTPTADRSLMADRVERGFAGPDGTFTDGWTSRLPEELGEYRNGLAKFKTVADFARSYQGLEQKLGSKANLVAVPTEKSTPQEMASYRKALGIPENPGDYKLETGPLPEGFQVDEHKMAQFSQLAHKLNIPPSAAKELLAYDIQRERARNEVLGQMALEKLEQGRQVLQQTFGQNYDAHIELAVKAAKTVGVNVQSPGFTDPQVVIAFSRLAQKISDDQFVTPSGQAGSHLSGAARAKDIQSNKSNPDHEKYRSGDRDTIALVRSLLQQG
ncbi:MAG: hypothetical protein ABIP44_08140, partial [Pseudoxanthomonas sp.]